MKGVQHWRTVVGRRRKLDAAVQVRLHGRALVARTPLVAREAARAELGTGLVGREELRRADERNVGRARKVELLRGALLVAADAVVARGDEHRHATHAHLLELGVDELHGAVGVVATVLAEADRVHERRAGHVVGELRVLHERVENVRVGRHRVRRRVDVPADAHDVLHIEVGLDTDVNLGAVVTVDLDDLATSLRRSEGPTQTKRVSERMSHTKGFVKS